MNIVVCIRLGLDGEISPFDACAYEQALRIENANVTLLSMGAITTRDQLTKLTRLGAKRAILLCDKSFAGADTLATAYTLSLMIKKLKPDYVFCGRQTLIGDTAQTGVMLSKFCEYSLITNVMNVNSIDKEKVRCLTRDEGKIEVKTPAVLTIERINNLRLPRLRSKTVECEIFSAEMINADKTKCGLLGSPTRVVENKENKFDKRKCKFIKINELNKIIELSLNKKDDFITKTEHKKKFGKAVCVTDAPIEYAKTITDNIEIIDFDKPEILCEKIKMLDPDIVLWGSDCISKRLSATVAVLLDTGLCADCTSLETNGKEYFMIRPALSGSVLAKIKCIKRPSMATFRTTKNDISDILVGIGFGAKDDLTLVQNFANKINAECSATRKMVDNAFLPYEMQVGLTGKSVNPSIYIAVGISGAIHHIVGIKKSKTIIAINPDKSAPIFDYADYGIIAPVKELSKYK